MLSRVSEPLRESIAPAASGLSNEGLTGRDSRQLVVRVLRLRGSRGLERAGQVRGPASHSRPRRPARGAPAHPRGTGLQPPPDPRSWPRGAAQRRSPGRTRPTPTLRETQRGLDYGRLTQTHEQHRLGDPLGHLPAQTQRRPLTSQEPFWRGACAMQASRPTRLRRAPQRGPARRAPAARWGAGPSVSWGEDGGAWPGVAGGEDGGAWPGVAGGQGGRGFWEGAGLRASGTRDGASGRGRGARSGGTWTRGRPTLGSGSREWSHEGVRARPPPARRTRWAVGAAEPHRRGEVLSWSPRRSECEGPLRAGSDCALLVLGERPLFPGLAAGT